MARLRGFATVQEHDEAIIERWNKEVGSRDTVILAGDAAMGVRRVTLQLFKRMNGTKFLVAGNHDDCWPGHSSFWTRLPMYQEVFSVVQPFMKLTMDREAVLVSHFPYRADHTDPPRFNQFRLRDEREWLLHGHTHSSERRTSSREIHIGADAWNLTPVAEYRIIQMMRNQLQREKAGGGNAEPGPEPELPTADDGGADAAAGAQAPGQEAEAGGAPGDSGGATPGGPARDR
jgi:calcineurin-like phosphoesterase family protein